MNIFPGFAASEVLYDENGAVKGVATSDMGIGKNGEKKPSYEAGYELLGKYTIFAEGVRGNLSEEVMKQFNLREDADPQHYGIGIKEIWEIEPEKHEEGLVVHTAGWPMDSRTEGGGFLYHAANNKVFAGFIVAPQLQESAPVTVSTSSSAGKRTPRSVATSRAAERIAYGARAVNKGGMQSLPKLAFPGGMLVGLQRRIPERCKDQGRAHRDKDRHACS